MSRSIVDPPEYDIYLPVRCYTCGFVIGKFQQKYEEFLLKNYSSPEELSSITTIDMGGSSSKFRAETSDVSFTEEDPFLLHEQETPLFKQMMETFRIPKDRFCCRRHFLSPICLPTNTLPICSISKGRETLTAETRPKHIFTTRTFDDISNKRNTYIEPNIPVNTIELDLSKETLQLGVVETTKIDKIPASPSQAVRGSIIFPKKSPGIMVKPISAAGSQPIIKPVTPRIITQPTTAPKPSPISVPVVITGISGIIQKTKV